MQDKVTSSEWMPFSLAQLDFWEEFIINPNESYSNVAQFLDIDGVSNKQALINAITTTIQETDVLSLKFDVSDGQYRPKQVIDRNRRPSLEVMDFRNKPDAIESAKALMRNDFEAPIDLLSECISAQWLIQLTDDRFLWYIRAHHIVLDGFSMALIEQRCSKLYSHYLGKIEKGSPFNSLPSYVAEEASYNQSRKYQMDRQFWHDYLAKSQPLTILNKAEEPNVTPYESEVEVPGQFSEKLQNISNATKLPWPDILIGLSGLYILQHGQAHSEKREESVWVPYMNRFGSVGSYMPALLVNILPVNMKLNETESVVDFLRRTSGEFRKLCSHGRYRVEQIAKDQGVPDNSRFFFGPFVNIIVSEPVEFEGCKVKQTVLSSGLAEGLNITFRSRSNASEMAIYLEADSGFCSEIEFFEHTKELGSFLEKAIEEIIASS
ncbi:putative Non-ribosomal peptide synthetase module [Vibrio nigripulchritudo MADA3029]|uniref:condensation domain-containing protein n=1 Tax=Vibrio nigripulchritudo TaxID=28173 RepID=UPI0003B201A4|nr:condensation domain-containing protein [Vibrio nigripulchritudo]CCN45541.1 putative Non-ribosomal peptide synthetase module [Vibrio nigripulchritudo MADA3020]CCN55794.1 putative Non-ribosomal peptide synthetase module [Vibrio nigripulchritudo MADA3021]CCN57018.1 putative Non-ribosomal peptide synthetase module [Vibrio nigripulchritudo MADA3029]